MHNLCYKYLYCMIFFQSISQCIILFHKLFTHNMFFEINLRTNGTSMEFYFFSNYKQRKCVPVNSKQLDMRIYFLHYFILNIFRIYGIYFDAYNTEKLNYTFDSFKFIFIWTICLSISI